MLEVSDILCKSLATFFNWKQIMAKIYIAVGSETGTAGSVALALKAALISKGHSAEADEFASLETLQTGKWDALIVCTATTGQGDLPDSILPFYQELNNSLPQMPSLKFGVISLGDSSYDTFCQAGEAMQEVLYDMQAQELIPRLKLDALETVTPDEDALIWLEEWLVALAK